MTTLNPSQTLCFQVSNDHDLSYHHQPLRLRSPTTMSLTSSPLITPPTPSRNTASPLADRCLTTTTLVTMVIAHNTTKPFVFACPTTMTSSPLMMPPNPLADRCPTTTITPPSLFLSGVQRPRPRRRLNRQFWPLISLWQTSQGTNSILP